MLLWFIVSLTAVSADFLDKGFALDELDSMLGGMGFNDPTKSFLGKKILNTSWDDEEVQFICENKNRENRDELCKDKTLSIIDHPMFGMETQQTYLIREGDDITIFCQANKQWGSCAVEYYGGVLEKMTWNGAGMDCWGIRNCSKENLHPELRETGFMKKGELGWEPLNKNRMYKDNICAFQTKSSINVADQRTLRGQNFRCIFYGYSKTEYVPRCCIQAQAWFTIDTLSKPKRPIWKSVFFDHMDRTCKIPTENSERDIFCQGLSSNTIIAAPTIRTGDPVYLKEGENFTIYCQSNFRWGYCGLEKIKPTRYLLRGISCPLDHPRDCNTKYEELFMNPWDLSVEVIHKEFQCKFTGIVTKEWEGTVECQMAPMSTTEPYHEKCCQKISYGFEITLEKRTSTMNATSKSRARAAKDYEVYTTIPSVSGNCRPIRFDTRHKMCNAGQDFDISIEGVRSNKLKLRKNSNFTFSVKSSYAWSYCQIGAHGEWRHEVWCQAEKGNCQSNPLFPGARYNPSSTTCSFTKTVDDSDKGQWIAVFFAANPHPNTDKDCCRMAWRYFNVTFSASLVHRIYVASLVLPTILALHGI